MKPKSREEYRNELADVFASVLEEKGVQWHMEWQQTGGGNHRNGVTGAMYRGCNAFNLALTAMAKGYTDPRWVTMHQIRDTEKKYHAGQEWHLKKGSKATWVEYWMPFDTLKKKALTWNAYREAIAGGASSADFSLVPRYTAVFNAQDVEGMPAPEVTNRPEIRQDVMIRHLLDSMHLEVHLDGGDQAYYNVREDIVHLPLMEQFENAYAFHSTALHEIAHATGHPSRLNRLDPLSSDPARYAYEELVAEVCACFMGFDLGEEMLPSQLENHKAYVRSWANTIRNEPGVLLKAIRDAQNAATYLDFMCGNIPQQEYELRMGLTHTLPERQKSPKGRNSDAERS